MAISQDRKKTIASFTTPLDEDFTMIARFVVTEGWAIFSCH
jgi:hypothetical protein